MTVMYFNNILLYVKYQVCQEYVQYLEKGKITRLACPIPISKLKRSKTLTYILKRFGQ